jgi:NO-binding membrane sensor protein with MHYT domain
VPGREKFISGLFMAAAIVGMHYTGMLAATFVSSWIFWWIAGARILKATISAAHCPLTSWNGII